MALNFKRLNLRERGIYVPFEEAVPVRDDEDERRGLLAVKLRNTLYGYWHGFAREHFDGLPEDTESGEMLPVFLSAYVAMLWRFKRFRKHRSVAKYAISIRINAYDRTFHVWKKIAELYNSRFLEVGGFYERITVTAMMVGEIGRELELIGNNQMNAAEVLVERELQQEKAASIRHAENRAMKADVFGWLDSNMHKHKSMDEAAGAVAGKIAPIGFRTARDWVGEWKKVRSPPRT